MSRFLISCGGTGGHLAPGIALAEGLHARDHETRLLISEKKVDARLVEKYPALTFLRVPGSPFGWSPRILLRCLGSQFRGVRFCLQLARTWRPDVIVGFGGFTSAPAVLAGRLLGIPVALHEANRVPGRAVRTLGRFARRVYLPPGIELRSVPAGATRHVGLPVRHEVQRTDQVAARIALGLEPDCPVLAILGGSLERFATEIRNLQHTEIAELMEPFRTGQKGSSAMPHKRNPILSERVAGLARLLRTLEGHTAAVWSVAVAPDGLLAVSGSYDRSVRWWNLATGRPVGGWVAAGDRGFRDSLKGASVSIVDTRYGDTGFAAQGSLIKDILARHPNVDYIVGTAVTAEAAVQYLRKVKNKHAKVLAYYFGPAVNRGIRRGTILAAPSDREVMQARLAVDVAVRALEHKPYPRHAAVPVVMVDAAGYRHFDQWSSVAPPGFRPIFSTN